MAYDLNWNKVVFASHCNGTNGSSSFIDLKGATVGFAGGPVISTAQSKFDGSSIYFNGTSRLLVPAVAGYAFGAGDFDIEFCFYGSGLTGTKVYSLGTFTNNAGTNGWWGISIGTGGIDFLGNGFTKITGAATILTTAWYHARVKRSGTTVTIDLDGTQIGSGTVATSLTVGTHLVIGAGDATGGFGSYFTGYFDEILITKGVARASGIRTEEFPSRMPQLSGTVLDNSGALASREVVAYRLSDKLQTGSVSSDGLTGVFNVDAADASTHFAIALGQGGDNDLILGSITPA